MEPILTREEIADLLAAFKSGKISAEFPEPGCSFAKLSAAQDIDLFRTYERHGIGGEMRIPNLDIVLDNFVRHFSTSLANTLQRGFNVERESIVTTSFEQSLQDLKGQGIVGVYSLSPLKYGCLFHFDTLMAFTLLEIMLGSSQSSESLVLNRHLTTIEMAILRTVMEAVCHDLEKAIHLVAELHARLTKVENNFRLLSIVEPEIEVLVTTFRIRFGREQCGTMRSIIPFLTLEPLREQFKSLATIIQGASTNWSTFFFREALKMECTVTARSGVIDMSIRSILNMQVGDIIDIPYNLEQPLTIMVENQPLYLAIPGERDGKKAVHITSRSTNPPGGIYGNT